MNLYQYPDYMYHYGVLGMKWGIRRASKYKARAASTKSSKLAKKYTEKANKIESYHKSMGGSKAYKYTKNESLLKSVGKSYVLGTYGALKYNDARAKGADRGEAVLRALPATVLNSMSGGVLSVVEPRMSRSTR